MEKGDIVINFGVIIDLDGTLIHKGNATLGASELIKYLKLKKIPFRIITNSVGRTPSELAQKVKAVGIDIEQSLFLNPIIALDKFLVENNVKSFYFVGPKKIAESLSVVPEYDDYPEYVILSGLEEADYNLLNRLFGYLKKGSKLLTMSRSEYYITEDGPKLDTGAFTRMLESHAKNEALLFGKPSAELFRAALIEMDLESSSVMVIGDDVMTDIRGAKEYGLYSVLVRTGKYQFGDELKEEPHFICNNLIEIVDAIDVEYPRFFLSARRTFN
ncbi:MAG: hypothetical protein CVU95_13590 [Firmicutes bacterium HGW-Firmicutes-2]|nr:MAG: hypothetical protein CVU95_13590 [Firmicutes bacterium HGW-Firmicutes-2]